MSNKQVAAQNPFAFKPYDDKLKKENAAQYMPPSKRKQIKEYLSNSSITLREGNRGFDGTSSYKQLISDGGPNQEGGRFRPSIQFLKNERDAIIQKHRAPNVQLGIDAQFSTPGIPSDMAQKVPKKYHVPPLAEMKQQAKNHHYNLGMRGLSSDLKEVERQQHESELQESLKERNQFLMYAQSIKNTVRNSNFKLAQYDHANKNGAKLHVPEAQVKGTITPRVGSGDLHFHRQDIDLASTPQINYSPVDKFGKKMMPPEKSNIKFGENGIEVKSPQQPLRAASNDSEKKINKFQTSIDLKNHSHEAKSGLYQQKYNKNPIDPSKIKDSVTQASQFKHFRNRNLYQLNLPIKDHNYQMPTMGVLESDLHKVSEDLPERVNPKIKPNKSTSIQITTQKDGEYKPTYGSIFTAKSSVIDPKSNDGYHQFKKEQMSHHKINLLSPNYREMYDVSKGSDGPIPPQYNRQVPQKSSVTDRNYQYIEQKNAMMNNQDKNSGVKNLIKQSQSQNTSVMGSHRDLNKSYDIREEARNLKESMKQVSLKLGYDDIKDRSASIAAGPTKDQLTQELIQNYSVYQKNKITSQESKMLFKNSGAHQIQKTPTSICSKGVYNQHNLNNKPGSKNDLSTNSQTYKWTIPKYDI